MEMKVTDSGTAAGNRPEDIERAFRDISMDKYKPPDITDIDPDSLQTIQQFHSNNLNLATPHSTINLERLDNSISTISPISNDDTLNVINSSKNKAPGLD